uniref:Membrane protein BRI3 n=1 Tax=Globodera rostochiensis TaxID=31243 RepID=A0A914HDR7_GLORO
MPLRGELRCPACRRALRRRYTLRGLLWAMLCFPCGMFCCMRRQRRRCSACNSDVVISDGGVPTVAHGFQSFAESKWQFPPPAALRIGEKSNKNSSSSSSRKASRGDDQSPSEEQTKLSSPPSDQ